MLNINASTQVFIACGATDLRKSIDGLSTIVQDEFDMNPFSEQLFVFCNQNRNRIKVLHWTITRFGCTIVISNKEPINGLRNKQR